MAFISLLVVFRWLQEDLIDLPKIVMFIAFHIFIYLSPLTFIVCKKMSYRFGITRG